VSGSPRRTRFQGGLQLCVGGGEAEVGPHPVGEPGDCGFPAREGTRLEPSCREPGLLRYVSGELPRALQDPLVLSLKNQEIPVAARREGCAKS
jgi:hypothetical protein